MKYIQRIVLTTWRKKTTILVASGLLTIILIGLQYSRTDESKHDEAAAKEEKDAQVVADALMRSINVKFIEANKQQSSNNNIAKSTELNEEQLAKLEQPSREEIAKRQAINDALEEQHLGIPSVIQGNKPPYIPARRIVHFDLKGAPPLISYLKKTLTLIKVMGATGILLEYEDMFPYQGILKPISAKNAYTMEQIKEILKFAEDLKLEVIPLIQTFGHVEFALKHLQFGHLREVAGSPQALCPSRNGSIDFIREMVNQVMALHENTKYLHIGCDEVFQMGECEICRLELHETLFLKHVKNVVNIVREKYPKPKLIIWDDMLRHLSQQTMTEMKLGDLVEPMVWVYAEDIYRFVQLPVWDKYSAVFNTAWAASAFKGAFGETLYIPNARRHLENNLRWLEVMSQQSSSFQNGFSGIVITGWQRYDHFAVLCELLPAAIPSLALSLTAVSRGYFNSSLRTPFLSALSCPQQNIGRAFLNLEADSYLWEKLSRCLFPGNAFFRLTSRLHITEAEANEYIDSTRKQKGWMTNYNIKHNYSLPLRVDELTTDLPRIYHGMLSLARAAADAMVDIFDNYTIAEWIEQRIYPYIIELETLQNQSFALKSVNQWASRPLPPLKDLQRLGISLPIN